MKVKATSHRSQEPEFEIDEVPSGSVDITNPGFSITGERMRFSNGFALSHGQLKTFADVEFEGMSPKGTDFQLYSHVSGKSKFLSNDFAPVDFSDASVSLFRPREEPGGLSKIRQNETINCFELHFSIEKLIEWFDGDPPENLRPLLKSNLEVGLGLPLPLLNGYHQMLHLIDNGPFTGTLKRMALEGMALQMIATYFSYLGDEKTRDWPGIVSREQRLAMQAREMLLSDLRSPPDLSELSRTVGLAPRRLNLIFRETFGQSVFQTFTNARLENSRTALLTGQSTIKEIAFASGYNHVSNFSTAFKSKFGISPAQLLPDNDPKNHQMSSD